MDQFAYSQMLVRNLKGAALSIWAVMILNPAKVVWEVDELITATDYEKDAILRGRKVLISQGLAAKVGARFGLCLTDAGAKQLPLPIQSLLNQGSQQDEELISAISDEVGKIDLEVGKIDLSPVVGVGLDQDQAIANNQQQHQQPAKSEKSTSLDAAGIHGKKRRALLDDDWVTPERIDDWLAEITRMAAAGYKFRDATGSGFMIDKLESRVEPPIRREKVYDYAEAIAERTARYAALEPSDPRSPAFVAPPDPIDLLHAAWPPINSTDWAALRAELQQDIVRSIADEIYCTAFTAAGLQLVVADQGRIIFWQTHTPSIQRILKRTTARAYTVEIFSAANLKPDQEPTQ